MKPIARTTQRPVAHIAPYIAAVGIALFTHATTCLADLTADVQALLRDKIFAKAEIGVEIVDLSSQAPRVLFKHNSDIPLIPASNLKLITTAAALEKLGAEFQFKTQLVKRGDDLILIGDGDPAFGDAKLLKKVGWDVDTVFKSWADGLKKAGVSSVANVYVDDSVFDQQFAHPNWPADQMHKWYVAQVGGMNLNANCLDFFLKVSSPGERVSYVTNPPTQYASVQNQCVAGKENAVWLSRVSGGNSIVLKGQAIRTNTDPIPVTINDPPMYAATVFAETLKRSGIAITGKVDRDRTVREKVGKDEALKVIGTHNTRLLDVISRANKDSINLYAEALCKRLGFASANTSGTWANGTAAVKQYLVGAGVSGDEFTLDDGCGLSKKNAISANGIAQVLTHEFAGNNREAWISTLAVGGEDGTLDNRFEGDLKGRVHAKSGYVNRVSCLSGYMKTKKGNWYAFSILMNDVVSGNAKTIQEKIVKAIDTND